jgi:hypothetical protein
VSYTLASIATNRVTGAAQASALSGWTAHSPAVRVGGEDDACAAVSRVRRVVVNAVNAGVLFGFGAALEVAARVTGTRYLLVAPAGTRISPTVTDILDVALFSSETEDSRTKYIPTLPGAVIDAGSKRLLCLSVPFLLSPAAPRVQWEASPVAVVDIFSEAKGMLRKSIIPSLASGPSWEEAYACVSGFKPAAALHDGPRTTQPRGSTGTLPYAALVDVVERGQKHPYVNYFTR